jgi:hypothetical protein
MGSAERLGRCPSPDSSVKELRCPKLVLEGELSESTALHRRSRGKHCICRNTQSVKELRCPKLVLDGELREINGASSTQSWKALHMQEYFERRKHAHPLSVNFGPSSDFGPRPADWKVACSSSKRRISWVRNLRRVDMQLDTEREFKLCNPITKLKPIDSAFERQMDTDRIEIVAPELRHRIFVLEVETLLSSKCSGEGHTTDVTFLVRRPLPSICLSRFTSSVHDLLNKCRLELLFVD